MPSVSSPNVTSSLANRLVDAEGLKKWTPVETTPQARGAAVYKSSN